MFRHLSSWQISLCLVCFSIISQGQPVATNGILDARSFDFSSDRLNLAGTWIMYDQQLLSPGDVHAAHGIPSTFPQTWNDVRDDGQGVASYSLLILLGKSQDLALDLPQIYSSYRLWVNEKLVAENGIPGRTRAETKPQWMPQTVSFHVDGDSMKVVLQIANFHHYKGGCKDPIYLGDASRMMGQHSVSVISKLIECGVLLVVGVIFLILYFQQGMKKVVIYFSLLCLTWSVRCMFSNDYTFISFFPDFNWTAMIRIEYISLYLTMMWAILYLGRVFTNEGSQIVKYLLVTLNGAFLAYSLFAAPSDFTKLLPIYLVTSAIVLVYGAGVVLLALINERLGATFLTISVVLGLITFSYDIFTYEGFFTYNSLLFSAGYIVIFLMMGVALLIKLDIIKTAHKPTTMLTYKDLYGDQ